MRPLTSMQLSQYSILTQLGRVDSVSIYLWKLKCGKEKVIWCTTMQFLNIYLFGWMICTAVGACRKDFILRNCQI